MDPISKKNDYKNNVAYAYDSLNSLMSSKKKPLSDGSVIAAGAFKYIQLPSASQMWHIITASGVKYNVLPDDDGNYELAAFTPMSDPSDDMSDILEIAASSAKNAFLKISGNITILKTVRITSPVRIVGHQCQIFDPNNLDTVLNFIAHHSSINQITFRSTQTLPEFQSKTPKTVLDSKAFVRFENVHGCEVTNVTGYGKQILIFMQNCYNSTISQCRMVGFLPSITAGETGQSGSNNCTAVCILAGANNRVTKVHAENHGSIVLTGRDTSRIQISNISGNNLHDNGVYCSSCTDGVVENCIDIFDVSGTGIKVRGSRNVIRNCYVLRCGSGYVVTGNGLTTDEYGANGHGNYLLNSTTENDYSYPWQANAQDGYLQRDLTVIGMVSLNGSRRGGSYAANIKVSSGLTYMHNSMVAHKGRDYALIVSGSKGNYTRDLNLSKNDFHDGEGAALRLQYTDQSKVSENLGTGNRSDLIELRNVNNLSVTKNSCLDQDVIQWSSLYPGYGSVIEQNEGRLNISRALNFNNSIS